MAFPWPIIASAKLASGNIVEDMQLSFDLLVAGHAPQFCCDAEVIAPLPKQRNASLTQRTRWEHGHLQTLLTRAPRLALLAIYRLSPQLLFAAADLSVPPLSLLVGLWGMVFVGAALLAAVGGSLLPVQIAGASGVVLALAVAIACRFFVRNISFWRFAAAVPAYVLGKAPIYLKFLVRRESAWVRTDRDPAAVVTRPHIELGGRAGTQA
ncbi:MAG: hypothetical protein QM775_29715 [Pirellulales bacterium]